MKVAFLGLGRMGAPMAHRLIDAGHDVVVWNRSSDKTEGFANVAERPTRAVEGADLVITMLSDADALRQVVYDTGLPRAMRLDGVFCDMSTIGVRAATRMHETIERMTLDAPVGGGVAQAAAGELVVLAGGDVRALDRVRSVLTTFGDVVHCGDGASGQAIKLAFNAVLAVTMSGIGEAIAMAEKLGLDTELVIDVLGRGGAGPMVTKKGPMIASGDYAASFALSLMRKDANLVSEAARDAHAWMPMVNLATQILERAERDGLGDADYSGITELFRRS